MMELRGAYDIKEITHQFLIKLQFFSEQHHFFLMSVMETSDSLYVMKTTDTIENWMSGVKPKNV